MLKKTVTIELQEAHVLVNGHKQTFDIDLPRYVLLEYLHIHEVTLTATDQNKAKLLIEAVKKRLKGERADLEALGIGQLEKNIEDILFKKLEVEIGPHIKEANAFTIEGPYYKSLLVNRVMKRLVKAQSSFGLDQGKDWGQKEWVMRLDDREWRWPVKEGLETCYSVKLINLIGQKRIEVYLSEGNYLQLILKDWWHIKKEDPLVMELMLRISRKNRIQVRGVSYLGRQILFETS